MQSHCDMFTLNVQLNPELFSSFSAVDCPYGEAASLLVHHCVAGKNTFHLSLLSPGYFE
ncbi:hypothetical protein EC836_10386 [Erwinia sp. JUb26]|nr:hypothetical protein EC836_10386 [Erwinia sp. JUb26]